MGNTQNVEMFSNITSEIIQNEEVISSPQIIQSVRPEYEPTDYTQELQGLNISAPTQTTALKNTYDLDTTITIDMADFESVFHCPLCKIAGDVTMLTLFTLSEHVNKHKYELNLAERNAHGDKPAQAIADNLNIGRPKVDINAIKDLFPNENIRMDKFWDDDEYEYDVDGELAHRVHVNIPTRHERDYDTANAIKQSIIEAEFMGNMNEDDAIAAAIAASKNDKIHDIKDVF